MGRSVDERVVEMRFDNQQFERGVKSTMGTLDRLKQSLKLDGAAKGLEDIDKAANGVSFDGIAAGVESLQKRFSTFGIVGMRVIQNITDSAMRFAKNTVGFVTDSIVGGGKRRAMNIENAHFQLQGLLKDEAKVQAVMDDAMDSVDGTSYAYDEAAKAASQFAASGMQAGEQMQSSLRGITGVAAMTNSEYESISQIFTTVAGNGRLMGDQLLQLSSRGLNAAATIADYMTKVGDGVKVTETEVRDMVSEGKISFEIFAAAMDDAFGEHAKKANETFSGAMSNVKASLARIGAEFVSPLIVQNGPLVEFFNALRERINDVKANIGPLAELFTDFVSGMANSATKYLQDLDLAKPFEVFYNTVDVFRNVLSGIFSVLRPIRWAFADIFPQSMTDGLVSFTSKLKEFTSHLRLGHTDAVNLRNTFKGLFAVLDIVRTVIGGVVQAVFPMTKGISILGSGILMITGQIGEWLTALNEMIQQSGAFQKIVQKVGGTIGGVFQSAGEYVRNFAKAFGDFVRGDLGAAAESRIKPLQKICEIANAAMGKLTKVFREAAPVLSKAGEMVVNTIGKIGSGLQKAVHGEGFDSLVDLMNGGLIAGIGVGITNFIGNLQKNVIKANGMFTNVNLVLANVKNTLISYQAALKAEVLMKIAKAIAVLAGSLFVLSLIDSDKLSESLMAISVLFGELSASMAVFDKTLGGKGQLKLMSAGAAMVGLSAAVLILSAALKVISGIDSEDLGAALLGITVLLSELVGAAVILSKWGGKVKTGAAGMVLFASALYILTKAVKQLSEIDTDELTRGLVGVGVLLAELSAFMLAAKFGKLKASQGLAIIELAAALLILQKVVSDFGEMDTEIMVKGLAGVAGALLAVAAAALLMPKNMPAIGFGLAEVAVALQMIGGVIQETGGMGWEDIGKGMTVLGGSMAILAVALHAMKGTLGGASALLVLSAALAVFTPCLKALGKMGLSEVGIALLALAGVFSVLGIAATVLGPMIPVILGLSGALTLLGIGVAACGAGILALSIGLSFLAVSGVAGMTAFVTGMEILFVGMLNIIAQSAESIANAVKAIVLAMVSVVLECAPAVAEGVLTLIEEVLQSLAAHGSNIASYLMDFLIGVMNAVAERLPELIQAAVNLIGAFFRGVVEALQGMDTTALLEGIAGVGLLSALMRVLSAVAGLIPSAIAGVIGMGVVMAELALVLAVIGGLAQIPGLEWLIREGGDLLQEIGTAIGKFIGGIVGGLMGGISSVLPQIGLDLSQFMINAAPFFAGINLITADTLAKAGFLSGILIIFGAAELLSGITNFLTGGTGLFQMGVNLSGFMMSAMPFFAGMTLLDKGTVKAAKNLAEMIMLFTAADFLNGITSWLTGGSSLSDFGEELADFGPYLAKYAKSVEGIKPKTVKASANAALAMAELANNLPNSGGVVGWFAGENDIDAFGAGLKAFGGYFKEYYDVIKDIDDTSVITASANAALALAELANNLPNSGGVAGWFAGENDIDAFGESLKAFGGYFKDYYDTIKDIDDASVITASANAAKALGELANNLPNSGGLISWFTGENDIGSFGEGLKVFGGYFKEYYDAIKDIDDTSVIIASANASKALVELANNLPNTGGLISWFTGDNDIGSFGESLKAFGGYFKDYYDTIKDIDDTSVITASANAAKALGELAKTLADVGSCDLDAFGEDLEIFGQSLVNYYSNVSGIDTEKLNSITAEAGKLAKLATSGMMKGFVDGAKDNQPAITKAFATAAAAALKAIQGKQKNFVSEGRTIVNKFVSGVKNRKNAIKSIFSETLKDMLSEIRKKQKDFYSAGSYLVDGFTKGIDENSYKAAAQAKAMAENAEKAAKEALDEHSPSKVFVEIGEYVVDGFANGIKNNKDKAAEASERMAQVGVEAAKAVLESLKDSDSIFAEFVQTTDENGNAIEVTLEQAAEAFKSFRDSVKDSVKSATGLFDEFEVESGVTGKELIKNLKSQIAGISEWASNIKLLADRGIHKGLLKALSDLGPSGAKYVNALVMMSGKELKKLNKLYKKRLALNDKTADQISASFLKGGKKAVNAYKKGLVSVEKDSGGNQTEVVQGVFQKTGTQALSAVREMALGIRDILSWTYEDAVKRTKASLAYGQGAFQQFCDRYLTSTKNIIAGNRAVKAASQALTAYGKKVYEESEYYEEDTKNLKEHQDALARLQQEKAAIEKDIEKKEKKNTKKSKKRVKELQKTLKAVNAAIDETTKQIKEDETDIAEHTKEVFENLHATLADSVSSFLDPLKNGLESGVDLFKKYETNGNLYEKDKENLEGYQKSLEELEEKQKGILDEINQYADKNTFAARARIKELKAQLSEVEESIEETKKNIEQTEKDMESHSEVTVDKILENMQSQIDGVKNWQRDLQTLAGRGISQGLYDKLKNMGTDGADYIAQFLKMTNEELSKANELFAESENLASQTLLNNFRDTVNTAQSWAAGLQELAERGFSQELLEKLGAMGPDSSDYIRAFLAMTPEQIAQFNQEFAKSLTLPDTIADQVMSSYAYAGVQSIAGFQGAVTALSKDALGSISDVLSKTSGMNIADEVIKGLTEGFTNGASAVAIAAKNVARTAYMTARDTLGIRSPSKRFAELGEYADAGLEKGLVSGERGIYQTVAEVMEKAIREMSDRICSDMDMEPSIRPVMDLSEIQNGACAIGGMLNGYDVSGSVNLAAIAAEGMENYGRLADDETLNAIHKLQKTLSGILEKPSIEQNNNFSITGNDPREIADEVSYILQKQVERRNATWA